jgi:hypothetical protein
MPFAWNTPVSPVIDAEARALVTSGWDAARSKADQAFNQATSALQTLGSAAGSITNIPIITPPPPILPPSFADVTFLGVRPQAPANAFQYSETPYSPMYLSNLIALLDSWVNGKSTGLDPVVEQAIWDRGRSKEVTASVKKAQDAIRSFAIRGFSKPPGALSLELQDAAQEMQNNVISLSREVMIKQADLEQTNRRFALETAWKVQDGLMHYMSDLHARALDAAKEVNHFALGLYQATTGMYVADGQVYAAKAGAVSTIYKAQVDGAVANANIQIEASKANLQVLVQKVTLLVETMRTTAQVAGQLAASAMAAINLSGGLQSSTSNSASNTSSNNANNNANASEIIQHDPDIHYSDQTTHQL